MSDRPQEFKPVEDKQDQRNLLIEGAKTLSSTVIWTKDQGSVINTHLTVFSVAEPALYFFHPKDLDVEAFLDSLEKSGSKFCFFSVSLPKANIFFKAKYISFDTAGIKFAAPAEMYTVQRRKDVRLPIPMGYVMKVEFDDPLHNAIRLQKKVIDISATGISFLAPQDEEAIYQPGVKLKDMHFTVKGRKITVTGEVKHSKPFKARASNASGVKVGVEFVKILPGESQHIAGYVFEETRKYYTKFL